MFAHLPGVLLPESVRKALAAEREVAFVNYHEEAALDVINRYKHGKWPVESPSRGFPATEAVGHVLIRWMVTNGRPAQYNSDKRQLNPTTLAVFSLRRALALRHPELSTVPLFVSDMLLEAGELPKVDVSPTAIICELSDPAYGVRDRIIGQLDMLSTQLFDVDTIRQFLEAV